MNYNLGKLINGNLIYFQQPSEILGDATQYALDNGYKEVITIDGNGTMYETDNSIIIERLPVINVQQTFSKLEFINRFTDTELVNIYTASKTIIEIEIWLDKFKLAEYIDITSPTTVSGLQSLESNGLIGEGRANQIINGN